MVHGVGIHPDFTGQGLSKPLMVAVLKRFRECGHMDAFLDTGTGRLAAVELYLSLGFVPMLRGETDTEMCEEHAAWVSLSHHLKHTLPRGFVDEGHVFRARSGQHTVRVGAVQMISIGGEAGPDVNLAKAERYAREAQRAGVQILCFPECASTSFDWVVGEVNPTTKPCPRAELVPGGPSVDLFVALAAELDMYIIFGCVEREEGSDDLFNTAFVCGPEEGYMGKFRKVTSEPEFVDGTEAPLFKTRSVTILAALHSSVSTFERRLLLLILCAFQLLQAGSAHLESSSAQICGCQS